MTTNNEPTPEQIADEMLSGLNRDEQALVTALSKVLVKGGGEKALEGLSGKERKVTEQALKGAEVLAKRRRR